MSVAVSPERRAFRSEPRTASRRSPDVGPLVDSEASRLFGAHVGRRPDDECRPTVALSACGCVREIRSSAGAGERLGQAEVQDLDHAGRRDLDVRRLQVAVDDASFVRNLERLGDLSRNREGLVHRKRDASLAEPRRESLTLDELQHQEPG